MKKILAAGLQGLIGIFILFSWIPTIQEATGYHMTDKEIKIFRVVLDMGQTIAINGGLLFAYFFAKSFLGEEDGRTR